MKNKHYLLCIGIRPDIIRFSLIIKELEKYCNLTIVHSNQHYAPYLNELIFEQTQVRIPDINLNIGSENTVEKTMIEFNKVLQKLKNKIDGVIVLGDNNSSLGFSFAAYKNLVPLLHIEGGMRSRNNLMQEERNRKLIDQMADLHFVYTEENKYNLLQTGIEYKKIFVVGNPLLDVLIFECSLSISFPQ